MEENKTRLDTQDILQCIKEEGYFPVAQDDGTVRFKVNGTSVIVASGDGCVSIRVYYMIDPENADAAIKASNEIMPKFILLRVIVSQKKDSIVFVVDSFCSGIDEFRKMLPQSIALLGEAIETHHLKMVSVIQGSTKPETSIEKLLSEMAGSSEKGNS